MKLVTITTGSILIAVAAAVPFTNRKPLGPAHLFDVPPMSAIDRSLLPTGKPLQSVSLPNSTGVTFFYDTAGQKIVAQWRWYPAQYAQGVVKSEEHAVPYRPTALLFVGTTSLIVAGLGDGGAVMIERWDYGLPGTQKIRKWPSGEIEYVVSPGPILAKTVLFNDPTAAEGPVNYFMTNHGSPGSAFYQFLGSRNVYAIDTNSGSISLALSGTHFPAGFEKGIVGIREVDHPTRGFLYFVLEEYDPSAATPRFFVMDDAQKDGTIDGLLELFGDDYVGLGYEGGEDLNFNVEWPPY